VRGFADAGRCANGRAGGGLAADQDPIVLGMISLSFVP